MLSVILLACLIANPEQCRDFKIQVSNDGSSWTNVATVTGNPDLAGVTVIPIGSHTNRYIRLNITAVNGGVPPSVYTFKVFRRP